MEQENTQLFTVQQFALQVGKTSQAIYQQIKGRLKPFVKKGEGGQVYITAEALKLYKDKQTSQQTSKPAPVDKDIQALQSENEGLRARIANLELHIEELKEANEAAEQTNKAHEAKISELEKDMDSLREKLAREQEISRERLKNYEDEKQTNRELIVRFPPQLPAGNAGGGLFGWLKRKKGDTNT